MRRQTYVPLAQTLVSVPIAVETMGAINSDGLEFLGDLGIKAHYTSHR